VNTYLSAKTRPTTSYSSSQGFTLIELLAVILITGILLGVAIPTLLNILRRAYVAEAYAALSHVGRASEIYRVDNGFYPAHYDDIKAIGPGSPSLYMNDPWSAPNYTPPGASTAAAPGHPTSRGIQWETEASTPKYSNYTGTTLLKCRLGLGSEKDVVEATDYSFTKLCGYYVP
jgi:general secretion pathway protein G